MSEQHLRVGALSGDGCDEPRWDRTAIAEKEYGEEGNSAGHQVDNKKTRGTVSHQLGRYL